MNPPASERALRRATPTLIAPDAALPDLVADLASRLSPEQRAAFLAKMAAMDRRHGLAAASVTLGQA